MELCINYCNRGVLRVMKKLLNWLNKPLSESTKVDVSLAIGLGIVTAMTLSIPIIALLK